MDESFYGFPHPSLEQLTRESNLVFHMRAETGVVKDGADLVSQWSDLGPRGYHLTQPTATNQPLWVANMVNGRPAIRFDGVDNYLTRAYALPLTGAGFTVALVFRPRGAEAGEGIYAWQGALGDGLPCLILQRNNPNIRYFMTSGYYFSTAHTTDAWALHVLTYAPASTLWSLYIDNSAVVTQSLAAGGNNSRVDIGNSYGGYAYMEIAELWHFDKVLSSDEIGWLRAAMNADYALW
jgi:hypothetical protein